MAKMIGLTNSNSVESLVVFAAESLILNLLRCRCPLFKQVFCSQKCYVNPLTMMDLLLNVMEVLSQLTNEAFIASVFSTINFVYMSML